MTISKAFRAFMLTALALMAGVLFSCKLIQEEGKAYLELNTEAGWKAYDTLDISWTDPATGATQVLYHGDPESLGATAKFLAEGFEGQPIHITITGIQADGTVVFQEVRKFDSRQPLLVERDTLVGKDGPGAISLAITTAPPRITIGDSVVFAASASVQEGSLLSYAWDYDGKDAAEDSAALEGKAATIPGGYRYKTAGLYDAGLRAHASEGRSKGATLKVDVRQDIPFVSAGEDTTVYAGTAVRLHGAARDTLGTLVRTEWKIGEGAFVKASGDTGFTAPAEPRDITCIFRAVDDDGQDPSDVMVVHVISKTESNLTDLVPSAGRLSPAFSPSTLAYSDTVPFGTSTITVTPSGTGLIKVDGKEVASGAASGPIALLPDSTTIVVSVQATGAAEKTYTLSISRGKDANADLKALALTGGELVPPFDPAVISYAVTVPSSTASLTPTATAASSAATITLNDTAITSGTAARPFQLKASTNTLVFKVKAASGAVKTYTVTVTRPIPGADADLSDLTVSAGPLTPKFDRATTSYEVTVPYSTTYTTVRPTAASGAATITVKGSPVASGTNSASIDLTVWDNSISVEVKAEDGTIKTYALKITRLGETGHTLNDIQVIVLDSADRSVTARLIPDVHPDTQEYHAIFVGTRLKARVSARPVEAAATLTINGQALASGTLSSAVTLEPTGHTVFNVVVKGADGSTRTYKVNVVKPRDVGYAVGEGGGVARTFDAGATWRRGPSAGAGTLHEVHFLNPLEGYAASSGGNLHRTVNGGASWSALDMGNKPMYDVYFSDPTTGFAVGSAGYCTRALDGSTNWTPVATGAQADLKAVHFLSGTGFAVGSAGLITRSLDGGATWTNVSPSGIIAFNDVFVVSSSTVYAVDAAGRIHRSTDAGNSWNVIVAHGGVCYATYWTSAGKGFTTCNDGRVISTVNGGTQWTTATLGGTGLTAIHFADESNGLIAADNGAVHRTSNGGANWIASSGVPFKLYGIYLLK